MAKLYGLNNAVDFAAKNLINFTSIFARSAGQPLDKTAIWYPAHVDAEWNVVAADAEGAVYKTGYERAVQYAATSAAYVGQELAVIDVTYDEDGTTVASSTVTIYCIQDNAGTLQEVGKATSGDGKSITLSDDGILSISGFEAAQGATLPQKQADGTIKWVAIDAIVKGDGNTKTVVTPTEGETHVIVDLVRDPDTDTNTYTISLKLDDYATTAAVGTAITAAKEELTEAIATAKEELEGTIADVEDKFDEAIGVAASEGVEASGLYAVIAAAEERAKAYADAGDADTIYDDAEVRGLIGGHTTRIGALETAVNGVEGVSDGLVGKVATHTTEIAGLKTKDTELASLIQGNTDKFADYYTKAAVDGLLKTVDLSSRLETSVFESYKTSQAELIATLATKSEVEAVSTEVAKKANAADVYDKTTADSTFVKDADFNDKVDARVNTLIDGANSEDTIKNVTNLVAFVNENAGDIAQLITDVEANTSAIAANKAAHEKNAADIATLITAVNAQKVVESTEISTATVEGGMQLGIKEVNVNKLVQTEGDVLILNGGSANI